MCDPPQPNYSSQSPVHGMDDEDDDDVSEAPLTQKRSRAGTRNKRNRKRTKVVDADVVVDGTEEDDDGELSDHAHEEQVQEEQADAKKYLNRRRSPRSDPAKKATRTDETFAAEVQLPTPSTSTVSTEVPSPPQDMDVDVVAVGVVHVPTTQVDPPVEEKKQVVAPEPVPSFYKWSDPNLKMKNELKLYFENIDPHKDITFTEAARKNGAEYSVYANDIKNGLLGVSVWSPLFTASFVRMYPLGNWAEHFPLDKYPAHALKDARFSMSARAKPTWTREVANERGVDKHMLKFFEWLRVLRTRLGAFMIEHQTTSGSSMYRRAFAGCVEADKDPTNKEVFAKYFDKHCLAKNVKPRMTKDLPPVEVPDTDSVSFGASVFREVEDKRGSAIRSSPYIAPHPEIAKMLDRNFVYRDIKLWNAADLRADADGNLTPVPMCDRKLEDDDLISLQIRISPYSSSGQPPKCGLALQPMGVMFFRASSGISHIERFTDDVSPRGLTSFGPAVASSYALTARDNLFTESRLVSSEADRVLADAEAAYAAQLKPKAVPLD